MKDVSKNRHFSSERYRQLSPVTVKCRLEGTQLKYMFVSDRNLVRP